MSEIREKIAEMEHNRWSTWLTYMFDNWTLDKILRWSMRFRHKRYNELPEEEKDNARVFADQILALLEQPKLIAEWFKKGQDSVRRKNESGCCCIIDEEDGCTIKEVCAAHADWLKEQTLIEQPTGLETVRNMVCSSCDNRPCDYEDCGVKCQESKPLPAPIPPEFVVKMVEALEGALAVIMEFHPVMDPEEPCTVYEAYQKINDALTIDGKRIRKVKG